MITFSFIDDDKSQVVEERLARGDGAFTGGKVNKNFPRKTSQEGSEHLQEVK